MARESEPAYRSHTNPEKLVACPYCDEQVTSRGLYMHVYNSKDDVHGGYENVPEDYNQRKDDAEVVGERDVTVVVPTTKEYDHELIMCKWCGETFKGTHGLGTHLGRVEDDKHPTDTEIHTSGIRIPATEDHEPVWTAEIESEVREELEADIDEDTSLEELFEDGELPVYREPPENLDQRTIAASEVEALAADFDRHAATDDEPVWGLAAERLRALVDREA